MDPSLIILVIRRRAKDPTDDLRGRCLGQTVAGIWMEEGGDADWHGLFGF